MRRKCAKLKLLIFIALYYYLRRWIICIHSFIAFRLTEQKILRSPVWDKVNYSMNVIFSRFTAKPASNWFARSLTDFTRSQRKTSLSILDLVLVRSYFRWQLLQTARSLSELKKPKHPRNLRGYVINYTRNVQIYCVRNCIEVLKLKSILSVLWHRCAKVV